jgi:hypothetical protein
VDGSGNAVVTGSTYSANFPVSANPVAAVAGYAPAAFLSKLNALGTGLLYSTLLGASGSSTGTALALDATNHAYVAGYTSADAFPVTGGALQGVNATLSSLTDTGFVTKIDLGSATACTFSLSPGNLSVPFSGGTVSASVSAPAGCPWEAIPAAPWLTVQTPTHGTGPGTITVAAASNASNLSARAGAVTVGASAASVSQPGGSCSTPQFVPASLSIDQTGGTGDIAVQAPASCSLAASTAASWITINGVAATAGGALVSYTIAADTGLPRSGTISIGSAAYTVNQVGSVCGYSANISSSSPVAPAGGTLTVTITASGTCSWTASANVPWIGVSPANGTGNGIVTLQISPNPGTSLRSGTVLTAGLSFTVTQTGVQAVPPTADSVAPSSGTGATQVFTAVYSDVNGGAQIRGALILFDNSVETGHTCFAGYDPLAGGFFLYADDSSVLGPIARGVLGTLQNSQCALNTGASTVTVSSTSTTVTFALTFKNTLVGQRNINLYAYDFGASGATLNSGWQTRGTYTAFSMPPPTADSVTPNNGGGLSQVFTAVYSDAGGAGQVRGAQLLLDTTIELAHTCLAGYDPYVGGFFLYDDNGAALGPIAAGGSGILQNSQCSFNVGASSLSLLGNSLTVKYSLSFKTGFTGAKNINLFCYDFGASGTTLNSGWVQRGTYMPFQSQAPAAASVSPSSGMGLSQVFTAVASDTGGAAQIRGVLLLFDNVIETAHTCYAGYDAFAGGFFLYDDNGGILGPTAPGAVGTLQNSQCALNVGASSLTPVGNNLNVAFSMAFKNTFTSTKNIDLYTYDKGGSGTTLNSGWQVLGSYTPFIFAAPTADSISPAAASGTSQVFTAVYSDSAGAAQVRGTLMLFDTTVETAQTCQAGYDPWAGGFFLYDDTGGVAGPIAAGGTGTLTNSRCTLNVGASSVTPAGNSLTVKFSMSFKSGFSGMKNIYGLAYDFGGSGTTLNSGWQVLGTYTPNPIVGPSADSISPNSGAGSSQLFTGVYSDTYGANQLRGMLMLFGNTIQFRNTCVVGYDPGSGGYFIYGDTGSVSASIPLGGTGTLQNSQCSVNVGASSLSTSGISNTLKLSVTFKSGFSGTKNINIYCYDNGANGGTLSSGWQTRGTWTLP